MNTILVPIDFSDATSPVVATASRLAKAFGSRIVLLHVAEPEPDFVGFEPGPMPVRQSVARDFKIEHQRLDELKQQIAADADGVLALHIQGPTVDKILHEATEQKASWIVMGSHGHGSLYELLVGSVTHGVMKGAKCPVVVVPVLSA
ncbi:MAG TPA: universal stress protein [Chthoniobacteraceae bacterium]|jgi:nucleotide-binding universal stress UspA family protein